MNETDLFQPLLESLFGDNGRVMQVVAWMGTARVALKLFSGKLQALMEAAIARVVASKETDDDEFVAALLKSKWYRIAAFLIDWVFSVKLPSELPKPPTPPTQ